MSTSRFLFAWSAGLAGLMLLFQAVVLRRRRGRAMPPSALAVLVVGAVLLLGLAAIALTLPEGRNDVRQPPPEALR